MIAAPTPEQIIREFSYRGDIPKGKKISLTLMFGMFSHAYQVKTITNTTYYKPGEWMSPEVAEQCCNLPNWEVTMVGDDIIQFITGAVGAAMAVKTVPGLI